MIEKCRFKNIVTIIRITFIRISKLLKISFSCNQKPNILRHFSLSQNIQLLVYPRIFSLDKIYISQFIYFYSKLLLFCHKLILKICDSKNEMKQNSSSIVKCLENLEKKNKFIKIFLLHIHKTFTHLFQSFTKSFAYLIA